MGNKGFTLIEVLTVLIVIAVIGTVAIKSIGSTLSVNKNETYVLMKNNIVSSSYEYLRECDIGLVNCDLDWHDNRTYFYATDLKDKGYFDNLNSPIDNKYLGLCLKLNVFKSNGTYEVALDDECY